MVDLAHAREVDPNKFTIGIGQDQMAVSKTHDIVTFAASAAKEILEPEDLQAIDMVIVGTESGIDESKASAVVLHRLLGVQPFARSSKSKRLVTEQPQDSICENPYSSQSRKQGSSHCVRYCSLWFTFRW